MPRHWVVSLALVGLTACATVPWPDEPGLPVPPSRVADVNAEEAFLATLDSARRAANLASAVVTPRFQTEIRSFADQLEAGEISAKAARTLVAKWGRVAYQRDVDAWALPCGPAGQMQLPKELVTAPAAVVSYAAAHFRPRSMTTDQCAILVVLLEGSESVVQQKL